MALIRCVECNKEFSEYAESCPKCGCPTSFSLSTIRDEPIVLQNQEQENELTHSTTVFSKNINESKVVEENCDTNLECENIAIIDKEVAKMESEDLSNHSSKNNKKPVIVFSIIVLIAVSCIMLYQYFYNQKVEEYLYSQYTEQLNRDKAMNMKMDKVLNSLVNQTLYWDVELTEWNWWYSQNSISYRINKSEFCVVVGLSFEKKLRSYYYLDDSYDDGLFSFYSNKLKLNNQNPVSSSYVSDCFNVYDSYNITSFSTEFNIKNGEVYYFLIKLNRNQLKEDNLLQYGDYVIANLGFEE